MMVKSTKSPKSTKGFRRGPLTTQEKYVIQGMLNADKDINIIMKELDRSKTCINNYIKKELAGIKKVVKKVRSKQVEELEKELADAKQSLIDEKNRTDTLDEMKQKVYDKLSMMPHLNGEGARLVDTAIQKNGDPPNWNALLNWALAEVNARLLMGRRTDSNKQGTVAVMTKAASERGDESRKSMPNTISRTARKNLFAPLDGKMIE